MMLDPGYNSYAALDNLIAREMTKMAQINDHIATLSHLKRIGAENGLTPAAFKEALASLDGCQ